jgi:hypothetical protein
MRVLEDSADGPSLVVRLGPESAHTHLIPMTPVVNQRAQAAVALAANASGQKVDLAAVKIIARRQHLDFLGLD